MGAIFFDRYGYNEPKERTKPDMNNRTKSKTWQALLFFCACMTWQAILLTLDKCKPLSCLFCGVAVAFTIAAARSGRD